MKKKIEHCPICRSKKKKLLFFIQKSHLVRQILIFLKKNIQEFILSA